jgi:hypothetical protein
VHELSAQSAPDSIRDCSRRLRMACGAGETLLRCGGIRADCAIPTGPEWHEQRPGEAVCLNEDLRYQAQQQAPTLAKAQATLRVPGRPSSCPQAHVTAPSTKRALYNLRPHIFGSCAATQQRDACSSAFAASNRAKWCWLRLLAFQTCSRSVPRPSRRAQSASASAETGRMST